MEGLVIGAGSLGGQVAEGVVDLPRVAVVAQGHGGRVTQADQLSGPLLGHAVVGFVDPGVGVVEVLDGLHLHKGSRSIGVLHQDRISVSIEQRPVGAVLPLKATLIVIPLDVEPHPAPLRITGDQLVAGEVGDPERVPG